MPAAFYAGPEDPLVSPDYSGWWSRTIALIGATWRPMALVQLIAIIPVAVLALLAALYGPGLTDRFATTTSSGDVNADWNGLGTVFAVAIPLILIGALLSVLISLAAMQLLVQRATGQPVSVGAALRTGLSRVLPMIGWSFVASLVALAGLICCILPVFYVFAALSVLPAVVLLERGEGIGRCFRLFHGNLGDSIARVATIGGLGFAAAVVEQIVSSAITAAGSDSTVAIVISAVVSAVFSVATGVVSPALLLTTYADMRARLEPFSTAYLMPTA